MLANFVKSITTVYGSIIRYTSRNFVNIALLSVDIRFNFLYLVSLLLISNALIICQPTAKVTSMPIIVTITPIKVSSETLASDTLRHTITTANTTTPTRATNESIIPRFFFIFLRYYFPIIFKYA